MKNFVEFKAGTYLWIHVVPPLIVTSWSQMFLLH